MEDLKAKLQATLKEAMINKDNFRRDVVRTVAVGARRRHLQAGFLLGPGMDAVMVLRRDVVVAGRAADLRHLLRVRELLNRCQLGVAVDARGPRRVD